MTLTLIRWVGRTDIFLWSRHTYLDEEVDEAVNISRLQPWHQNVATPRCKLELLAPCSPILMHSVAVGILGGSLLFADAKLASMLRAEALARQ